MSCPNMVWALYRPNLSPPERTVLVHLANRANRALVCWDPLETISRLLCLSVRTAHRAVHSLEQKGLIRIQSRHRTVNYYHVLIPPDDASRREIQPFDSDTESVNEYETVDNSVDEPVDNSVDCNVSADSLHDTESIKPAFLHDRESLLSPKKKSPKKSGRVFLNSEGKGRGGEDSAEDERPPDRPDREPTVAEILAKRKAAALDLAAMPSPVRRVVAKVLGLGAKAYAPGRSPRLTPDEQIRTLTPARRVQARYLSADMLAMMPHRRGVMQMEPA